MLTEINTAIGFKEFIQSHTEVSYLEVGLCSVRLLQSPLFRVILNTFYNRGGCREEVMLISISGQCVKGIDNEYSDAIYMWEERTLRLLIILLKYSISDTKPEQFIFFWATQAGFLCHGWGLWQSWPQARMASGHPHSTAWADGLTWGLYSLHCFLLVGPPWATTKLYFISVLRIRYLRWFLHIPQLLITYL